MVTLIAIPGQSGGGEVCVWGGEREADKGLSGNSCFGKMSEIKSALLSRQVWLLKRSIVKAYVEHLLEIICKLESGKKQAPAMA